MNKVKITVVKKLNGKDLYGGNPPITSLDAPECDRFQLGQEFISEEMSCPLGFCTWAFTDIYRDIVHLSCGGDYPWIKEKGAILACCTDGNRPVVFKLERINC